MSSNKRLITRPPVGTRVWFVDNADPGDLGTVVAHDGTAGVWVRWDRGDYDIPETAPDGETAELFSYRQLAAAESDRWIR